MLLAGLCDSSGRWWNREFESGPQMEQDKHQGSLDPLVGEEVKVALLGPLQQAMGSHLAKVVSELSEGIFVGRQPEAGEDRLMNISRAPSIELRAAMQQHLHKPHHARVVD